jgi:hypothetical protein
MSLNHLAKQVQSKGRGRDTMLVHMSPREVQGLQALALANGGRLSVNPDTGLLEAGFLENILPVVAAGALTAMTAGAAAPVLFPTLSATTGGLLAGAGIGALVGGGMSAIQGGDIGKGALMGGLSGAIGGYGGTGGFDGLFGSTSAAIEPATGAAVTGSDIVTQTGAGATQAASAPVTSAAGSTFAPPTADFATQQAAMAAQQAQMAQAGTLQSGLDLGGVGASPAAMAPGSSVPLATAGSAKMAAAPAGINLFGYNISPGEAAVGLGGLGLVSSLADRGRFGVPEEEDYTSPLKRISPNFRGQDPVRPNPYYRAQYPVYGASGGVVALANGGMPSGPVERMSMNDMKSGMYPQGMIDKTYYSVPSQRPASMEVVKSDYDAPVNPMTGMQPMGMAAGGISHLGGYSDGGRLLRGPGDGVSDDIPAQIGERQPARLADGEFVVPARIVSEIGNGSTEAGARKLYAMMDRVQKARRKSMGKGRHAVDSKAEKLLPV